MTTYEEIIKRDMESVLTQLKEIKNWILWNDLSLPELSKVSRQITAINKALAQCYFQKMEERRIAEIEKMKREGIEPHK